ncbi:MAG: hypothetical protein NPIRA03_38830 [Nitrospirales bacterium]|nr:MAG: hypothetical protein NPIRA03_38830 [Nitrospirales bacterium]
MPVGRPIPRIRVPALTNGNLAILDISQLKGQWVTLCCPSRFDLVEYRFLDIYRKEWEQQGILLVGLVSGTYAFHEPWIQRVTKLGLPLLTDPLRRVSRALKLYKLSELGRCQSLIINPQGIVEYHLIHDLSGRGMKAISEIFQLCQHSQSGIASQAKPAPKGGIPMFRKSSPEHSGKPRRVVRIRTQNEGKIKKHQPILVRE